MSEAYTSATQRIGPERIEDDIAEQPTDCALVQDLLPLYIDNEVSPESHARIAIHIAQCERCAGYLAGARSVRAQLLRDQQVVRTPAAVPPATRTPAGSAGALPPRPTMNTLLPKVKQILLIAAAAIGALILVPVLIPVAIVAAIPVGVFMIGRELWRRWGGQSFPSLAFPTGSASAMLAAVVSLVTVLVCAGLIFSGLVVLTETWEPAGQLAGILMLIFGSSGLVTINQRRGWLPQYASPSAVPELFKFILLGGSVLAAAVVVPNLLGSMPVLVIGLVLAWIFWPRVRGRKP